MEDKIVEIARFYEPEAAQMIESLLKSEGVNCYVRNEYTSRIQYPANVGGIRNELLESEVPRAKEILEANGYEFPNEDEEDEQLQAVSGWVRHIPFLRHLPLEKQIIVLFILVAVFLALVIGAAWAVLFERGFMAAVLGHHIIAGQRIHIRIDNNDITFQDLRCH